MSAVLDAIREKYPSYSNVSDDDLAIAIGEKYPAYLEQTDFKEQVDAAKNRQTLESATPFARLTFPEAYPETPGAALQPIRPSIGEMDLLAPPPAKFSPLVQRAQLAMTDPLGRMTENVLTGEIIPKPKEREPFAEAVPTGEEYQQYYHLPGWTQGVTIPASALAYNAAGLADYLTSAEGMTMTAASKTPLAPAVFAKWAYDMIHGGLVSAKDAVDVVGQMIHERFNRAIVKANSLGEPPPVMPAREAIQRLSNDAVGTAVMIPAGIATGFHGIKAAPTALQAPPVDVLSIINENAINQRKEQYASRIGETEKVYGDVRAQPVQGEGQVPIEESSKGIQPQAAPVAKETQVPLEPEKITQAAYQDEEGNIFRGANHPEIVDYLGLKGFETRESRNTPQFGYWTSKGRFVTREEAAPLIKASGQQLEEFDIGPTGKEAPHSDEVASPTEPEKPLGDTEQPVTQAPMGQRAIDYSPEDLKRYKELKAEQARLKAENKIITVDGNLTPEWQANWKAFEELRNKYNGMPPKNLEAPTPQPEVAKAAPTKPAATTEEVLPKDVVSQKQDWGVGGYEGAVYTANYSVGQFGTERLVTVRDANDNVIGQRDPFWPQGIPTSEKARKTAIAKTAKDIVKDYESGLKATVGTVPEIPSKETTSGALGSTPSKPTKLSVDQIDFDNAGEVPAYRTINESERNNPETLVDVLTDQFSKEGSALNKTWTRRLTVLRNTKTGAIEVVGTYKDSRGTIRMVDPTKGKAKNVHNDYLKVLGKNYEPIATILLDHPTFKFREHFDSLQDYENAFGNAATERLQAEVGVAPETGYEGKEVVPVTEPEVLKAPAGTIPAVTQSEARALAKVVGRIGNVSKRDFAGLMDRQPYLQDRLASAAIGKMFLNEQAKDPQASQQTLLERVYDSIYEDLNRSKDVEEYVKNTQARYPEAEGALGEVGLPEGTTGTEADLTQPDEAVPPAEDPLQGLGGARPGEFVPGGAAAEDIFGISQRVREEMAKTGRFPYVSPGQGTTAWEQIQRGRDLIRKGVDPEQILRAFEATKRISADDMAVLRAHMEDLYQRSRQIEQQYGTTSQQWLDAQNELNNFWQRTKPMQTEWHKIGEAQQGATDIDTGDLLSMERAWRKLTGRGFTPEQLEAARSHVSAVSQARTDVADAQQGVFSEIDKVVGTVKPARTLAEAQMLFSKYAKGTKLTPDQIKTIWSWAKNEYISRGETNIDAIAQGVADDFGIPKVTVMEAIAGEKGVRRMTDELYMRQARLRQAEAAAREWLMNERYPGWRRLLRKVPRLFFTAKVFGHGTVGMVTHVGQLMFDPAVADIYWKNFFRQYKLMVKAGYHEAMMQDLMHRPNFITARRAGLGNDPFRYQDDYQNLQLRHALGKWVAAGQRGFDVLKLVRQDLFDEAWNALDHDQRTPEQAKLLAKQINHATGIVTGSLAGRFDTPLSTTFFAPRLEASRWAFAIGDPAKALSIASRWKTATPEERMFAIREVKQKARIVGTYLSLLAVNQAMLTALGSDQQVNFTNPHRGDFLAFKMLGHEVSVISPILHMMGFLADMARMSVMQRTDFEKLQSRSEEMFARTGQYARGKLSPFAKPISDVIFQSDFMGKPMPFSSDKVPRWMIQRGEEKWTWPDYIMDTAAPIPAEEAIREVWAEQNMSDFDKKAYLKALLVFGLTGGTGIRLKEDVRAGE